MNTTEDETRTIELTRGKIAIVDLADYELVSGHRWYANEKGYAVTTIKRVNVRMHRLIMGLIRNDGILIDHINGDRTDNRRSNLRICDHRQNLCNRGIMRTNTTGYKGVSMDKKTGFYIARIYNFDKCIYLGYYARAEDAYAAYCKAAADLHGEFANYG